MPTENGPLRIEVGRDRQGSIKPLLIPRHARRFTGFDDKIVAMYDRGMPMREARASFVEQYGAELSTEVSITDAVISDVGARQSQPLALMRPVVFFDALRLKIPERAVVRNKAIYLALGVLSDATGDSLGTYIIYCDLH